LHPRHRDCLLRARRSARAAIRLPTQQALDMLAVAARHLGPPTEATRPPARLLLEQVRTKRLPAADLPRPPALLALRCAAVPPHSRPPCSPSPPCPPACTARARAGRLVGFSTIVMLRPSWRGADSTTAMSPTCSATRSRIRRPSSGWNTSRPRN